jgi:hypothetical protein
MKKNKTPALLVCLLFFSITVLSQKTSLFYTVKMDNPEWHFFHVQLSCKGIRKEFMDFKMPAWDAGVLSKNGFRKKP